MFHKHIKCILSFSLHTPPLNSLQTLLSFLNPSPSSRYLVLFFFFFWFIFYNVLSRVSALQIFVGMYGSIHWSLTNTRGTTQLKQHRFSLPWQPSTVKSSSASGLIQDPVPPPSCGKLISLILRRPVQTFTVSSSSASGLYSTLSLLHHMRMLIRLILQRPCAGSPSCSELLSPDMHRRHRFVPVFPDPWLRSLYMPIPMMIPQPVESGDPFMDEPYTDFYSLLFVQL